MPEYALDEAKDRLAEIVLAAERGERVVITKDGEPAVELVRCGRRRRSSIDFTKLQETRRRLGIREASPEELAGWQTRFEDPAFSRQVLGLGGDR